MPSEFNRLNPNLVFDFNDVVPGGLGIFKIILNQNPILYYRFKEDGSSTTVSDTSGYGNNGVATASGVSYLQQGPTGEVTDFAYAFDGTAGFIETPTGSPTLSQDFTALTVEFWLKIPFLPPVEQTLVGKGDGPGSDHFQIALAADGRVKFWYSDNSAPRIAYSGSPVYPNTWTHIMAIWDGTSNVVFLHATAGAAVANVVNPTYSASPLQIAAYNAGGRYEGLLDELAIYDYALQQVDATDRIIFDAQPNRAPVITQATANGTSAPLTLNIFQGDSVTFVITATDEDNDTLQYSFSTDGFLPSVGPQLGSSTTIQYTETGVFSPVAFVTDLKSNRAKPFPTINVDPVPDLRAFNDSYSTGFRAPKTLQVLTNDSFPVGGQPGGIFSVSTPQGGQASVQGTGQSATILYTPGASFSGTDIFEYTIHDGSTGRSTGVVTVEVSPKLPPQTNTYLAKIGPDTVDNVLYPQSNDVSDPPGELLTVISVESPTPQGGVAVLDTTNNRVLYTPAQGFLGSDVFAYVVEDEAGLSSVGAVSALVDVISYEAINDTYTLPYEGSLLFSPMLNDTTPSTDPRVIQSITQPAAGVASIVGTTQILYDAQGTGLNGSTNMTYTTTDGTFSATGVITLLVQEKPPRASEDRLSTTLNTAVVLDVMANDLDPEGLPLHLVAFGQPSVGGVVTLVDAGTPGDDTDDKLLLTPTPGFEGILSFQYTIEDSLAQSATTTCRVCVGYTFVLTVDKNLGPVTETFAFNAEPDAATGYDKSYTYFWVFGDGETSTSKSPSHDFVGIGTFDVQCTITDSYGVVKVGTVQVEVIANKRPIANDITAEVAEGRVLNFDPRINDFDPDGDLIFISNADAFSALGGSVFINGGPSGSLYDDFVTYNHPAVVAPFSDTFSYEIEDEFGLTASALVTVNILENLAPVAGPVTATTVVDTAQVVDLLVNSTDPESDPLKVVSVTTSQGGQASIISDSEILFTPSAGYLGVVTFDFVIQDTFQNQDQDQLTVSVFGANYPKAVVNSQPQSFWVLNDPPGSIAFDVMPLQNHAVYVNNVVRSTTQGPLALDGESASNVDQGFIKVTMAPYSQTITNLYTMELWVKNTSQGTSSIISDVLTVSGDGTVYQYLLSTDQSQATLTFTDREIDEWYYLVVTYDGQFLRGYIDLQLVTSAPLTGSVVFPTRYNLGLGMAGVVSSFAIYDRALDIAEISAHYATSVGPIVGYTVQSSTPTDLVTPGSDFVSTTKGRDSTGKVVLTENAEIVTLTSSSPALTFDANGDGIYE